MNPLIRAATDADIPRITAIYAHHVLNGTATFEIDPPDCTEMNGRWQSLVDGGFPYLVAELEGQVMGYAYAGPYRPRPAYRFTIEDSIYIHPHFMGRGTGRALLAKLIEICTANGYRQMLAVIGDSGNAASIRLHAKLGFRSVGVFEGVGHKFGRWIDTVLMQRALNRSESLSEA